MHLKHAFCLCVFICDYMQHHSLTWTDLTLDFTHITNLATTDRNGSMNI